MFTSTIIFTIVFVPEGGGRGTLRPRSQSASLPHPELPGSQRPPCRRLRRYPATRQRSRCRPPAPPRASCVRAPSNSSSAVCPEPPLRRLTQPHPRASAAPTTHPWPPHPPPPHSAQAAAATSSPLPSLLPRYALSLSPTQRAYRFDSTRWLPNEHRSDTEN